MIGLDTNILLRFLLKDDAAQTEKVIALFENFSDTAPGYISCITLMECTWFLRQRIKLKREQIVEAISDLLDSADLILEDERVVEEALGIMVRTNAEFADVFMALRNRDAGCVTTKTFDAQAAKTILGMELLS
ncbi:PIN domain-containing protein [Rhizobium etli]|uniref:Putative nucleic-acid-binding protein n=1 Tax=Rhizobium etli TaxID=29449 RepID=A0A7W6ZIB9_RHIET|nr:type II toxin-antitoxin system VapC family toxin [Rhizobium etli]MBB4480216.1 putative nucleic-acid-binding protein [Rhizobium etli]MBB4536234.1 putative nucleic-acid-binding protein [Rhizobium etli]